jgi:purine-binding chemotaxis protein CheW
MLGLMDLRGRSVPVLDLRTKLGLSAIAPTETTRILVLEVEVAGRSLVLGLVADRVFEVMVLAAHEIEPAPDIGVRWRSDYIRGVGHRDARLSSSSTYACFRQKAPSWRDRRKKPSPDVCKES